MQTYDEWFFHLYVEEDENKLQRFTENVCTSKVNQITLSINKIIYKKVLTNGREIPHTFQVATTLAFYVLSLFLCLLLCVLNVQHSMTARLLSYI